MCAQLWTWEQTKMWKQWGRAIARAVLIGSKKLNGVSRRNASRLRCRVRNNFYLKDLGPLLPGDEEAVTLGVVSDPVEHGFRVDPLIAGQQAGEIDPGNHVSVLGIDARDQVCVPDICVDLTLDKFQLVQLVDDPGPVLHHDVMRFFEAVGIAETKRRCAVAGDEVFFRAGPAL